MARGKGVVAGALACALVGCASILSIDGSYEVAADGGQDGTGKLDAPMTSDGTSSSGGDSPSSSSGGTSSSGGSGSSSSGSASSSGMNHDSGNGDSSGGDGSVKDPAIQCGQSYCDPLKQQCCITGTGQGATYNCMDLAALCTGTPLTCDDTDDCPQGHVCCGELNQQMTQYDSIQCKGICTMVIDRQFCNPQANDCPVNTMCIASMLLPGYYACGP